MKDIPANYTSALVPFAAPSLDCLENGRNSANEDPSQSCILSGVMKSGRLAWIARGDALEVVNIATGARKAAWKFGALLQEERSPTITCVAEYSFANAPKLLIGLETGVHAGMLCMFDVKTSKVVKAVDFMHKVTAVEPVTNVLATEAPLQVLSEHLRCFCGVVAIGTQYGHLYLIDMCLDDSHDDSDELLPHALHVFTTKARDVMRRRDDALTRGKILALHLNNNAQVRGTFQYVQPDGELLESYIAEEVFVTSLKFVHPIGTLIVGFNFGCFQMWRLYEPVLDFSSKLDIDDVCPITHFAYQEPENDPRNFCYLWVARGPLPSDAGQDIVSTVQLYQLSFQRRIWYDSYGVLYEDLLSVGVRLEHELLTTNLSAYHENVGSRVISCFTVENQRYQRPPRIETEDSFDEGAHGPDLSLCLFAWEVTSSADPSKTTCYLGLFDMNRWYHAQMPVAVRYSSAHPNLCAFFGMFSLDNVVKVTEPDDILAVHVDWDTVTRYLSHYVPPPELQFFPSSLAFSATCVTETGVIQARFLGIQRQVGNMTYILENS
ncbi:protein ELYS-like [Lingula anatina]|uniref:Protein ELYS-like n=1 Tax=Lingula anatina TaxID=7574 RepID=A0A1S3I0N4_LINAN|nr:protein ELYS-like [Lingula anatina]|eukprot:XP_013391825.1 protein ELYS-like [Lingula anatina]